MEPLLRVQGIKLVNAPLNDENERAFALVDDEVPHRKQAPGYSKVQQWLSTRQREGAQCHRDATLNAALVSKPQAKHPKLQRRCWARLNSCAGEGPNVNTSVTSSLHRYMSHSHIVHEC
jgi:hypothetical protein